jgi:hypothetical protein
MPPDVGLFRRPGQALQNALTGNPWGASAALLDPEQMTEHERDALFKKHGLDKSPWAGVLRLFTNPVFLLAALLTIKFPVPSAKNIFRVGELAERELALASKLPWLKQLRSSHALFRGTTIPDDMYEIGALTHNFQTKIGNSMGKALEKFSAQVGRFPNAREQQMVAAWLDGLHKKMRGFQKGHPKQGIPPVGALFPGLEKAMDAPTMALAKDFRGILDKEWMKVFGSEANRKKIVAALGRLKKSGLTVPEDGVEEFLTEMAKQVKPVPDYFAHRVPFTQDVYRKTMASLLADPKQRAFSEKAAQAVSHKLGPESLKRHYKMVPNMQDLGQIQDLLDPAAMANLRATAKARIIQAMEKENFLGTSIRKMKGLSLEDLKTDYARHLSPTEGKKMALILGEADLPVYSMQLLPVMGTYTHTMASTYAWTIKDGGKKMLAHYDLAKGLGRGSANANFRAAQLADLYIPILSGRGTFKQHINAQIWNQRLWRVSSWMDDPGVQGVLGESLTNWIKQGLTTTQGSFSMMNLNRHAASYFYMNTLGLNVGSAFKNLFQLVLTTGPILGYGTMSQGIVEAMRKSHKYFSARYGPRKASHERALRFAYPDYAKTGLATSPLTDEAVQNAMINAFEVGNMVPAKMASTAEKIGRAMMKMFSFSENAVRLSSFEAGLIHAKRGGLTGKAAITFGRKVTEATQFLTGPQNTPLMLLDKSPLVRQLTQFPLRAFEFASNTVFHIGGGKDNPLGMNPYAFARGVLGTMVAAEAGDAIGLNVEQALWGAALPGFTTNQLLAPIPIVPPVFQLGAALATGIGGDWSELRRSTPLVIPGGTAGARAIGYVPGVPGAQQFAEWLGRSHADYNQPSPDGKIPVYTGTGSFRGYFSPWEVVRAGMGIPGRDYTDEQELVQLMVRNRDKIREYRREYLEARMKNQASKANTISKTFRKRFGFDLPVTEKHLETYRLKKTISRLEQVLQTMPPGEARDRMADLVRMVLESRGQGLLGLDPDLLTAPKPRRDRARVRGRGGAPGRRAPYHDQMGPLEAVSPRDLGRQPYPKTESFSF